MTIDLDRSTMPRRQFLRRLAGGLTVTAVAAACGANNAATTAVSSLPATTTPAPTTAAAAATAKAAPATIAAPAAATTAKAAPATTAAPAVAPAAPASGASFDPAHEMAIAFSFVADTAAGGRFHNPYVAVWVEDAAGAAVRSISLNYQLGRGDKWLPDLTRWFRTGKATAAVETISSATKVPGAYKLVWDGMSDAKKAVPQGDYFVCIEAAREKGPYQLVREQLSVGATPFVKALAAKGELQDVSVELRARS